MILHSNKAPIEHKLVLVALLFFVGMGIFFPFPTFLFGEERFRLQQDLLQFIQANFSLTLNAQSDSLGMWVLILIAFLFSMLAAALLSFFSRNWWVKYLNRHTYYSISSFLLAYFLLKYGLDKVFKNQFYAPEISIEYTPIYQLDRDILYWTTMGKSYSYSLIIGLLEVIPAFLLLYNRTRLLGNMLALAAFTHILAINIGFDITVKFLASSLLLLAIVNILLNGKALYSFFILQIPVPVPQQGILPKSKLLKAVKFVFFSLIVLDCSAVYIEGNRWNGDVSPRSAYYGAYEVEREGKSESSFLGENGEIKRIFFQRRPYVIFQTESDHFIDFGRHFTAKGSIILERKNQKQEVFFNEIQNGNYTLTWTEINGKTLKSHSINFKKLK